MFAMSVGFIGAFHLLDTTVNFFGKGRNHRGNQQEKREDWYCFFQPSDLLGEPQETSKNIGQLQPTIDEAKQRAQRRQQQATRPRLQL